MLTAISSGLFSIFIFILINKIQCTNARTYAECRAIGREKICSFKQNTCFIETRKDEMNDNNLNHQPLNPRGLIVSISMGCKQATACYQDKKQNFLVRSSQQCFPGMAITSVCRQCCHINDCNKNLDPTDESTWILDHPGYEDYVDLYYAENINDNIDN